MALFNKKVDTILKGARKIVKDLRTCAIQQTKAAGVEQVKADKARDAVLAHCSEATRANKVADAWDKLVNGD